jgi:hypothetical protein
MWNKWCMGSIGPLGTCIGVCRAQTTLQIAQANAAALANTFTMQFAY